MGTGSDADPDPDPVRYKGGSGFATLFSADQRNKFWNVRIDIVVMESTHVHIYFRGFYHS
jgi:hypothetical protein